MVMLMSAYATGYETINGLKYLINTDDQTATLVADTVKYSGDIVVPLPPSQSRRRQQVWEEAALLIAINWSLYIAMRKIHLLQAI